MLSNFLLSDDIKSRSICPENPDGSKGGACKESPLPGEAAEKLGKGWKVRPFVKIEPGATHEMALIDGPGEIKSTWITGNVDKGVIIRMYWDDQEIPSVECPLTDFSLYGWAQPHIMQNYNKGPIYRVDSALMAVNPNRGFNCFIPMPFRKKARITLENRTTELKNIYYQVNYEEKAVEENAGYFHAQYRVSMPVKYQDVHTILDGVQGKGVYIGTALYVGLNRAARWWGEGEAKFYIDGDKEYPTICSTGLEDYFGGAFNWEVEGDYIPYNSQYFGMPYVEKPDGLYNVQQRFSLYRWHVMDPIRFDNDLKVTIQDLGWKTNDKGMWDGFLQREDDFISVAYWYQTLPTAPFNPLIAHSDLLERF